MMRTFCFDKLAVLAEDIHFVDPDPYPGQEGAERGVRVELRLLDPQPQTGSVYSSSRIVLDTAVWRVDILESVAAGPGSRDRVHYHPDMADNEPGDRVFDSELSADPETWLAARLAAPADFLGDKLGDLTAYDSDLAALRTEAGTIVDAVSDLLRRVRAGELAQEPA
ncbi:hypothetical protein LY13_002103 [Prauserella aidingensis]|uniref:hypothetical protein n=1 Tax=Prauserella aidingensis TaxID=387890 RepID=UPI0020A55B62|nr:hypothetical protein [Prauserella aidingensis]MCP2253353.1 hypothetical protein [Prauserella aidingensis]